MAKAWLILIIAAVLVSFAVFLSALLRANGRTEEDDEEQLRWCREEWEKREDDRRRKAAGKRIRGD